ncbi:MAG TPA: HAMP domain-containing protein, partial [Solirubrobacteraceae bacterium]|nr:HAMP domain-containing protein [Solirubrobacteraceae bacterium]
MIGRTSIRWRLVAWVSGVLLMASAVIFVVVYERTGQELRNQIDHDVAADVTELTSVVHALGPRDPRTLLADIGGYLRAQPYSGTSSLLFASIPGHGSTSNHPELIGGQSPDDGESPNQQAHENALEQGLLGGPTGLTTRRVADVGKVRVKERIVRVGSLKVRVGAGEPLVIVERAEHGVARSFVIAGALALLLALIASYLAGASLSLPLRRMARVAARVDEGDLHPRMQTSSLGGSEVRVLAESFNHMLDRLAEAFAAQREFIADASHELRTPLTVIGGQLEVLAAQERPDPEEVRRVERLVAAEIARTMARPRPAPPALRSRAESVRWKRAKTLSSWSEAIPGPSSMTTKRTRFPGRVWTSSRTRPFGSAVCSTALRIRLRSACASRSGSAVSLASGMGPSSKCRSSLTLAPHQSSETNGSSSNSL